MNDLDTFETALLEDLRELVDTRAARRRRRRRLALAGGAVAACVAAAAVIGLLPQDTGPLAPQRAEASVVLDRAAQSAGDAPATSGTYWHMRQTQLLRVSKNEIRRLGSETWQRKDGTYWYRAAGHDLTHERGPANSFSLCDQQVDYDRLATLPTNPGDLRESLRYSMEHNADAPVPADDQTDFITGCALSLLGDLPASPEVRAAAFRLLADQPGTTNLGPAQDELGRSGTKLRFEGDLVAWIDQQSGLVLQYDQGDGNRNTVIEAGWTDQLG